MHSPRYYMPIENLKLSWVLENLLKQADISTVGEILDRMMEGPESVLSISGFTDDGLDELITKIAELERVSR